MKQTLIISNRGQLTLPAGMRKRYGLQRGGAVIVEERDNELVIKPAAIMEIELYSAEQIAEWDSADLMTVAERGAVVDRLASKP